MSMIVFYPANSVNSLMMMWLRSVTYRCYPACCRRLFPRRADRDTDYTTSFGTITLKAGKSIASVTY